MVRVGLWFLFEPSNFMIANGITFEDLFCDMIDMAINSGLLKCDYETIHINESEVQNG